MDVSKWNIIPEENDTVKTVIYHEIIYIYNMSTKSITFQRPGTLLPAFGFSGWYPNNPGTIWKPKLAQEGRVVCGLWASRGCEMLPLLLLVHDFSWVADNSIPVWVSDS